MFLNNMKKVILANQELDLKVWKMRMTTTIAIVMEKIEKIIREQEVLPWILE